MPCSLSVISVTTPSVPSEPMKRRVRVVAGRALASAAAGLHDLAVRRHHGERQHVVLHGAVADRVGARRAGRHHAAERRVRTGIDREEQARVAQQLVELLASDAGLDHAVEVLRVHRYQPLHHACVDRHAAERRVHMPFERGPDAVGDDRHMIGGAQAHDLRHLGGILRVHHEVGWLVLGPGRGVAVLLAHREARHHPVAIALEQFAGQRLDGARIRLRGAALRRPDGRGGVRGEIRHAQSLQLRRIRRPPVAVDRGARFGVAAALLGVHDTRRAGAATLPGWAAGAGSGGERDGERSGRPSPRGGAVRVVHDAGRARLDRL